VVKGETATDVGEYSLTVQDLSGVPDFGCGDDTSAPDAFYEFEVTDPAGTYVTVDTRGSVMPTVVAIFPISANYGTDLRNNDTGVCCDAGCADVGGCDGKPDDMIACDSDSGPGNTSLIYSQHLPPGLYNVVVRGRAMGSPPAGYPNLPFNLSVRDEIETSSLACSDGVSPLHMTLDPGEYHVVMTGRQGGSPPSGAYSLKMREYVAPASLLTCNTASDTIVANVDSGKPYYVVVKGGSLAARGPYKLTVENYEDTGNMGCNADPLSPDAFFRFHLDDPTNVTIDTNGTTLDTVVAVYPVGVAHFGTNYAFDEILARMGAVPEPLLPRDQARSARAR
jgi:hypothetical protein